MAIATNQLIRELIELIEALDRRVPRVERAGEASIARDAARLRAQAVRRVAELTDQTAGKSNLPAQASTARHGEPRR